jgi:general secretion pathway protein L
MPLLKNVLGLDLGSHDAKAVEIRQSLRSFEVIALRNRPGPDAAAAGDPEFVRGFVSQHLLSTEHVVAALRGDRISSRRISLPFTETKKIAAAIPFEVEEDLPFDIGDCLIDWETVRSDRSSVEVIANVATRAEVARTVETLREAGCPPHTLEAEGLVLSNLAALFDLGGTRMLVDLGHEKTTFCTMVDGAAVAARTIPVAGRHLSEAIARDRGLTHAEAERVKCEEDVLAGGALPGAVAVVDRIGREILRSVGALEETLASLGSPAISQLTLIGGTAQLAGIERHLSERTQIPAARIGAPIAGHGEEFAAMGSPVVFAPALALALRGTSQARTRTNFLQDEFAVRIDFGRYRRDFGTTALLGFAAFVLAVIGFAVSTVLESRRADDIEAAVERLYGEAFPDQRIPDNTIAALRQAVRDANDRAEFLGVYPGNLSALDLLSEISRRVPNDLDIVFEELTIDRQMIRMRVFAKKFESADRLGAELAKFGPFSRAQIGAIENDPKRDGKRFTVTITLAPPGDAA